MMGERLNCCMQMSGKSPPTDLYVKNFLKKVIIEVESSCDDVLDELYEQFSNYMVSTKVRVIY